MTDFQVNEFLRESNAIEGVYDNDSLRQAIIAWEYCIGELELTVDVVLKTHKILMLNQDLMPNEKGYFRTCPVYIGGYPAMHHAEINISMNHWCKRVEVMRRFPDSFDERMSDDIKNHHVMYEKIHPFVDGNGRTGRIFMNWQRVRAGLPILIIREHERFDYYEWFRSSSNILASCL